MNFGIPDFETLNFTQTNFSSNLISNSARHIYMVFADLREQLQQSTFSEMEWILNIISRRV